MDGKHKRSQQGDRSKTRGLRTFLRATAIDQARANQVVGFPYTSQSVLTRVGSKEALPKWQAPCCVFGDEVK
jgi:hypothetical protein